MVLHCQSPRRVCYNVTRMGGVVRVRIKALSEEVPSAFICNMVFAVLGIVPQDCERKVEETGFLELELEPQQLESLRQVVKRYSFLALEEVDKVLVLVKLRGKETSVALACNILSGLVGSRLENCEKDLKERGEMFISVDKLKLKDFLNSAKAYPFLSVKLLQEDNLWNTSTGDSSLFSDSWRLLSANVGFFAAYGFLWLILMVLSMVPLLGFLVSFFTGFYSYLGILYLATHRWGESSSPLQFSRLWHYLGPAVGIYLGSLLLMFLMFVGFFFLFLIFGGLGMLSDLSHSLELEEYTGGPGLISALIAYALLFLLWLLYYLYTLPLVYSRTILGGLKFETGFLSVFYPFTAKGLREAFSNTYFKLMVYLAVVLTLGMVLAILCMVTILLIPVGVILFLWMLSYFALTVGEYLRREYKPSL